MLELWQWIMIQMIRIISLDSSDVLSNNDLVQQKHELKIEVDFFFFLFLLLRVTESSLRARQLWPRCTALCWG